MNITLAMYPLGSAVLSLSSWHHVATPEEPGHSTLPHLSMLSERGIDMAVDMMLWSWKTVLGAVVVIILAVAFCSLKLPSKFYFLLELINR